MMKIEELCERLKELDREAAKVALEIHRERERAKPCCETPFESSCCQFDEPMQLKPIYGPDGKTQIGEIAG